ARTSRSPHRYAPCCSKRGGASERRRAPVKAAADWLGEHVSQPLEIVEQRPGAEESLAHPLAGGAADPLGPGWIAEQRVAGPPERIQVVGVVDQDPALAIDDLVLDSPATRRDHRPRLPHRL